MPHNHAPHCCCYVARNEGNPQPTRCPSCVEHGELARLNMPANAPVNQCPEESPSIGLRCLLEAGHNGAHNTTNTEPWPSECPSCHATGDQPHTDYCQRYQPGARCRDIACPGKARCTDPDCAQARQDDNAIRAAHAQTSQPAATTSQPPTQTRGARCQQDGGVMCSGSIDCECKQALRRTCTGQPLGPMGETVHHAWCPIHG